MFERDLQCRVPWRSPQSLLRGSCRQGRWFLRLRAFFAASPPTRIGPSPMANHWIEILAFCAISTHFSMPGLIAPLTYCPIKFPSIPTFGTAHAWLQAFATGRYSASLAHTQPPHLKAPCFGRAPPPECAPLPAAAQHLLMPHFPRKSVCLKDLFALALVCGDGHRFDVFTQWPKVKKPCSPCSKAIARYLRGANSSVGASGGARTATWCALPFQAFCATLACLKRCCSTTGAPSPARP